MHWARRSYQPWLLRLAAFVLFISGGSLAQRYLTAPAATRALPLERQQKESPSVVLLESRKFEVQGGLEVSDGDAAVPSGVPLSVQLECVPPRVALVLLTSCPPLPLPFDALAPPTRA
jgi:hypothetical protein